MRKFLLILGLLLFTSKIFAQQYSQYNTGTLFDSFENPAQRSFIPDSSRQFASNFLLPNFDGNFFLTGDGQHTLKTRYFDNTYNNAALQIGNGNHFNYVNGNANAYILMLKMFTGLDGNSEVGFFVQGKALARGAFTDESIALFNGSADFPGTSYSNVFNSNYNYQSYYQFGFTYREQVTKQFAVGFKVAAVTGVSDVDLNIRQSNINFDKTADTATLSLRGTNRKAGFSTSPFSNPGLSVSIGTSYKTQDGFTIQGNIKDLGFIHWNKNAEVYNFAATKTIYDLTSAERENNVYNTYSNIITAGKNVGAYNTMIDGTAELSVNKSFWIDDNNTFRYSPTLIASKELAYTGFTGAMVNPISYNNYTLSLVTSYNDMQLFDFGAQFMIKSPNAEFFIGTDRLTQSASLAMAQLKSHSQINKTGTFTGGDITLGFSIKFGPVIEHPMNASTIPMGEKGFLGKLWDKLFKPSDDKALQK